MNTKRYVVVEGPIGAGKSTLARRLAEHWGVRLVAEKPEENPFLPRFYSQFQHHALSAQLSFLLARRELARQMQQGDLMNQARVADFMFERDDLFAAINLDRDELALYRQLAGALAIEHPTPDLVIYLEASPETLVGRLAARTPNGFPDGYIKRVHEAYSQFFYDFDAAPLLIVNTDHLNLIDNQEDFDLLLRCISEMRGQRSYFNKSV
ncbi:deoxynucleoside kinase [Paludibacterium purpuratum]|uniref:Deoxyadenosine/deoxycytidine kinase n=1 Tax=Paludibacterium purpuratum TaxID=1144873 RepID=A0A4R7BBK7_9NEIS|nr:deoxynucleoside kinase [Paludibacterium purpuratum]TDR82271.1 deoxyadenosine/deoxycytidine kinase [Paludibacterium purpuratum]